MTDKAPQTPQGPQPARFKLTHYPDASFQRADAPSPTTVPVHQKKRPQRMGAH
jgi:hypothetical protein